MMSSNNIQPADPARSMNEENTTLPDGPREDIITTAVKFLQNPKTQTSPLAQRKAFLTRKGLTPEEVELAISRAGATEAIQTPATIHAGPPVLLPPPVSAWSRARDYAATGIVTAGFAYMIYQLYKRYVVPYIYGQTPEQKQVAALQASVTQLQDSVTEMMKGLQESINKQDEKLREINLSNSQEKTHEGVSKMQEVHSLSEIKDEIKNLKGLMLSRNQFPGVPATTPVLEGYQRGPTVTDTTTITTMSRTPSVPSWQLKPTNTDTPTTSTSQASVIPSWQLGSKDSDMENKAGDITTSGVRGEGQSEVSMQEVTNSGIEDATNSVTLHATDSMKQDAHVASENKMPLESQTELDSSEMEKLLLEKPGNSETASLNEEIPAMNGEVPLDEKIPAASGENPSLEGKPEVQVPNVTVNT